MVSIRSFICGAARWAVVVLARAAFVEFSVRVWRFEPTYSLQARAIPFALSFTLDAEILYRFLPEPKLGVNSLGFRDREFGPKRPGTRRIVVLGDSFPMGLAVGINETFPKRLESLITESEVFNLGVQGYGPDQELLVMKRLERSITPDLVAWSLFPANDYHDIIKNRIFDVGSSGELVQARNKAVSSVLPRAHAPMLARALLTGHFLWPDVEASLHPVLFVDSETPRPVDEDTVARMRAILREMREFS